MIIVETCYTKKHFNVLVNIKPPTPTQKWSKNKCLDWKTKMNSFKCDLTWKLSVCMMQSRLQDILFVKQQWLCSLLCCRFKMLFCVISQRVLQMTQHVVMIILKTYCFFCQVWNMSHISMLCLGVKPYACTMCDMRFIQRYQLERHSLTHTGMYFFFASLWSCMCYTLTNIYMAASNSSLYCFLSLYSEILMTHASTMSLLSA